MILRLNPYGSVIWGPIIIYHDSKGVIHRFPNSNGSARKSVENGNPKPVVVQAAGNEIPFY